MMREFEAGYLRPKYADLSEDPDAEEPNLVLEPPLVTDFGKDYLYLEHADLSHDFDAIEPDCVSEPMPLTEFEEDYLRYGGLTEPSE